MSVLPVSAAGACFAARCVFMTSAKLRQQHAQSDATGSLKIDGLAFLQCPISVSIVYSDGVQLHTEHSIERRATAMNKRLLRDTLEVLKNLRAEVQGTVETRVIDELDKAIKRLEDIQNDPFISIDPMDVLILLAKVLENLPQIADVIKRLMK